MKIFLAIFLGTIVFLLFLMLVIKSKIKNILKRLGYSNFKTLKEEIKKGEIESKTNIKHVTGMSKLLIPRIIKDFPNFSETELYSKTESALLAIFNSLETKKLSNNTELVLIKEQLFEIIKDYKESKINVTYDDVKFHSHALKYYKNSNGALNITVSTSLEYYYTKTQNGKVLYENKGYKKQTRYTTEFIYVYDPSKIVKSKTLIGINCPNCGAPVKELGNKKCSYCASSLEDINLKSWHISSYKEDY